VGFNIDVTPTTSFYLLGLDEIVETIQYISFDKTLLFENADEDCYTDNHSQWTKYSSDNPPLSARFVFTIDLDLDIFHALCNVGRTCLSNYTPSRHKHSDNHGYNMCIEQYTKTL